MEHQTNRRDRCWRAIPWGTRWRPGVGRASPQAHRAPLQGTCTEYSVPVGPLTGGRAGEALQIQWRWRPLSTALSVVGWRNPTPTLLTGLTQIFNEPHAKENFSFHPPPLPIDPNFFPTCAIAIAHTFDFISPPVRLSLVLSSRDRSWAPRTLPHTHPDRLFIVLLPPSAVHSFPPASDPSYQENLFLHAVWAELPPSV